MLELSLQAGHRLTQISQPLARDRFLVMAGPVPTKFTHCGRLLWQLLLARAVLATGAPTGKDKPVVGPRFFTTKNTKNHQGRTKVANRPALSNRVIGLAIDVQCGLGPSLVEPVYQEGMCMEVQDAYIQFQGQAMAPVHEAQILAWPRMSGVRLGFLMNVHAQGQQPA